MFIFKYIVKHNVAFVSALSHLAALHCGDYGAALFFSVCAFGIFALADAVVDLGKAGGQLLKIKKVKPLEVKH